MQRVGPVLGCIGQPEPQAWRMDLQTEVSESTDWPTRVDIWPVPRRSRKKGASF